MNSICADYVSEHDACKRDGSGRVYCPFCGEVYAERDMETYLEDGTGHSLQICSPCREGYEQDIEIPFESDVLPAPAFSRLRQDAMEKRVEVEGSDEATATSVAKALGGRSWQSGGGIWLVLIERNDGHLIVISEDVVCNYKSRDAFDHTTPSQSIRLA